MSPELVLPNRTQYAHQVSASVDGKSVDGKPAGRAGADDLEKSNLRTNDLQDKVRELGDGADNDGVTDANDKLIEAIKLANKDGKITGQELGAIKKAQDRLDLELNKVIEN